MPLKRHDGKSERNEDFLRQEKDIRMREESKDREINLIDLLAEVLLHWRGIIVAMLIGGGTAGCTQLCAGVSSPKGTGGSRKCLADPVRTGTNNPGKSVECRTDGSATAESELCYYT